MDTLNSAFVVEHITQTITSLLTILQTSRQATAHFEIQGLIEVLLSCKSLWLQSGYELCLFHKTVSFSDQTVVEFQELINRSSILCEALRSQTSLDECFGGDLERGYIGVLVFREREARRTETVVTEQLRVLSKLVEVCEPMAKSDVRPKSVEAEERESFETEKTAVDLQSSSSYPLSLWQTWIPGFKRFSFFDTECLLKASISSGSPSDPSLCSCRKCVAEAKERTKEIDLQLRKYAKQAQKERTILLLGLRDSNEQIIKLLLRVGEDPYTPEELEKKTVEIRKKLFDRIHSQLNDWNSDRDAFKDVDETAVANLLTKVEDEGKFNPDHAVAFEALWAGFMQGRIGVVGFESPYFLDNITRIISPTYIPTETDVLHLPLPFSRMRERTFMYPPLALLQQHSLQLNIINYHISCCSSKKVLHYFTDMSAVVFPFDLTQCNQIYSREENANHPNFMLEAIINFDSIVNSRKLEGTTYFLWLSNVRKFKEMVEKEHWVLEKDMKKCGFGKDGEKALKWVVQKFLSVNRGNRKIYANLLEVLDVENAKKAVDAMGDTLLGLGKNDIGNSG